MVLKHYLHKTIQSLFKGTKIKVVNEYLNSNQSTQDIAIKYNIRSSTQVQKLDKNVYCRKRGLRINLPKLGCIS